MIKCFRKPFNASLMDCKFTSINCLQLNSYHPPKFFCSGLEIKKNISSNEHHLFAIKSTKDVFLFSSHPRHRVWFYSFFPAYIYLTCIVIPLTTFINSRSRIFIPAFPLGSVVGATSLGGLEIPQCFQQFQIVLLAPHKDGTKKSWRCIHVT